VGEEELLLHTAEPTTPTSWSRDGRFLLFTHSVAKKGNDVSVLALDGSGKAIPVLNSSFNESQAQFSPDMRWIAYTSDESGTNEVYVRSFSAAEPSSNGGKWPVSNGGGSAPRWRRDGKELLYIGRDNAVMSVDFTPGASFHAGESKPLFHLPATVDSIDLTADGKRFLIAMPAAGSSPAVFNVVVNWTGGPVRE
jgi:Tol biopolymer transport system component